MDLENRKDKELEYYYREQGKVSVTGCCTYEQGYYCGYHENNGVDYQMEFWLPDIDMKRILRQLFQVAAKFSLQTKRDEVEGIIAGMYLDVVPFRYTYRFEFGQSFVRISKLDQIIKRIVLGASLKEREKEKEDALTIPGSSKEDKKKPDASVGEYKADDAKKQFIEAVADLQKEVSMGTWNYNRERFEKELRVRWCYGKPRVIKPGRDYDECDGNCPTPGKPKYTVGNLIKLINDNYEDLKNVYAHNWFITISDIGNGDCKDNKVFTRITELNEKFKLPMAGYVFSPRKKDTADKRVYKAHFDFSGPTIEYAGYKENCPDILKVELLNIDIFS